MSDNKPPYEYEDVTAILIEPMDDFIEIKKGSLVASEVVYQSSLIAGEQKLEKTITAIDSYSGDKIFFFASRLAAVRHQPENLKVVDGGVPHLARPLP